MESIRTFFSKMKRGDKSRRTAIGKLKMNQADEAKKDDPASNWIVHDVPVDPYAPLINIQQLNKTVAWKKLELLLLSRENDDTKSTHSDEEQNTVASFFSWPEVEAVLGQKTCYDRVQFPKPSLWVRPQLTGAKVKSKNLPQPRAEVLILVEHLRKAISVPSRPSVGALSTPKLRMKCPSFLSKGGCKFGDHCRNRHNQVVGDQFGDIASASSVSEGSSMSTSSSTATSGR